MGWSLIKTVKKEYTAAQILRKVNNERNLDFVDYSSMMAGLSLAVITSSLFTAYVKDVRQSILHVLGAIGIGATLAGISNAMEDDNDADALDSAINMIDAYGGTVTAITKVYEYTTGSGNHSTWKTETTYRYNKY